MKLDLGSQFQSLYLLLFFSMEMKFLDLSALTSFSLAAISSGPGRLPDSPWPGLPSEASLECLAGMLDDDDDDEGVLLLLSAVPGVPNCSFRAETSFSASVALCNT
jgi:hypothetical protein